MPTDPSTAPANATSRRTFLTRTAIGTAAAVVGVAAAPSVGLLPAGIAGAETLTDADFAMFAAPLELGAVQVYQAALDTGRIAPRTPTFTQLLGLQANHLAVGTTLATLVPEEEPPPVAAPGYVEAWKDRISDITEEEALMTAFSELEGQLSATHLQAIESLADPVTAKLVSQVLTAEAQNSAALAIFGGAEVADVTPPEASTDDAIEADQFEGAPPAATTTTTTTAAN